MNAEEGYIRDNAIGTLRNKGYEYKIGSRRNILLVFFRASVVLINRNVIYKCFEIHFRHGNYGPFEWAKRFSFLEVCVRSSVISPMITYDIKNLPALGFQSNIGDLRARS